MRVFKQANSIFKTKTGLSLLMVIGVMSLLFAISASVIVAAFAGLGYNARQNETNRIKVLSESIHRNIKFALENDPGNANSLNYQLIMSLFNTFEEDETPDDVLLGMFFDADTAAYNPPLNLQINNITLSWTNYDVKIIDPVPHVPPINFTEPGFVNIPAVDRIPKTADISATLTVSVEIEAVNFMGAANRVITTISTYEYNDGQLRDQYYGFDNYIDSPGEVYTMSFGTTNQEYGKWSLLSYDTIDSIQP